MRIRIIPSNVKNQPENPCRRSYDGWRTGVCDRTLGVVQKTTSVGTQADRPGFILTVSLDGQQTANTLFLKMLDHVYVVSPLR